MNENVVEPVNEFVKSSIALVNRCNKPDAKELKKIAVATSIGFAAMGVIGFVVKIVFMPINNILIGG